MTNLPNIVMISYGFELQVCFLVLDSVSSNTRTFSIV